MRLVNSIDRRQALLRALIGLSAGRLSIESARPAHAAYTVVSTGKIIDREAQLADVAKKFELAPDDPYVFGEKAQLEYAQLEHAYSRRVEHHRAFPVSIEMG